MLFGSGTEHNPIKANGTVFTVQKTLVNRRPVAGFIDPVFELMSLVMGYRMQQRKESKWTGRLFLQ